MQAGGSRIDTARGSVRLTDAPPIGMDAEARHRAQAADGSRRLLIALDRYYAKHGHQSKVSA